MSKNNAFSWLADEEKEGAKKLKGPITVSTLMEFLQNMVAMNPAAASLPVLHVEFSGLRKVGEVEASRDSVIIS